MKKKSKKLRLASLVSIALITVIGITVVIVLYANEVETEVTSEDSAAARVFLKGVEVADAKDDFENQEKFISAVQDSVLNVAPVNKGIPYGYPREPKDLLEAKQGLCFDRSRVIEKILRSYGYETRHVFIYSTKKTGSAVRSFITPGVPSHAVTEVWTAKGWLVVDSNDRWIAIDSDGNPNSMAELLKASGPGFSVEWESDPPPIYKKLYPFTYVYGLYSRHGEFYPPYNRIPDVNYGELLYNFY